MSVKETQVRFKEKMKDFFSREEGKKWLGYAIFSVVLWAIMLCCFFSYGFRDTDPLAVTTFLINGVVFYGMLLHGLRRRSYSFDLIHSFFLFSFMFFAPFVQYLSGTFPWSMYRTYSVKNVIVNNLLLDLWVAVYLLFYHVSWRSLLARLGFTVKEKKGKAKLKKSAVREVKAEDKTDIFSVHYVFLIVCVALCCLLAAYLFLKYGTKLFSRSTNEAFTFSSSSLSLLMGIGVPAFYTGVMALCLILLRNNGWKGVKNWIPTIAQALALLIVCSPTGMARFQIAVIYGGLAIVALKFLKKGPWCILGLTFGLLIVFPLLNAFRELSFGDVDMVQTAKGLFGSFMDSFMGGHYDAYSMMMLIQDYTDANGVSLGMQLLGVLLFFVPRSWWPGKPLGSGQTAARYFNWGFDNLSCPLPAEGLVNFGALGLILFAVVLAIVARKVDDLYWESDRKGLKFVYPFAMVFLFFLMRGDLLSSYAYTFGTVVVLLCVFYANRLAFPVFAWGKEKLCRSK